MSDIKCGDSYTDGVCDGCGVPERHCPMRSSGLRVEFLDVAGQVLRTTELSARSIGELETDLGHFVWPFQSKVHAVRVHWANRRKLIRRPAAQRVIAYGPGDFPRQRAS